MSESQRTAAMQRKEFSYDCSPEMQRTIAADLQHFVTSLNASILNRLNRMET